MAGVYKGTPQDLVDRLMENCIGFHYEDPKANGRTSHAFLFAKSPAAAQLKDRINRGIASNTIVRIEPGNLYLTEDILIARLYQSDHIAQSRIGSKASDALFAPVLCATRGSTVGSVTTVCSVRGYAEKTATFVSLEVTIVCLICRAFRRPGCPATPGTMAFTLEKNPHFLSAIESANTFRTLLNSTGFECSRAMADAMLALIIAWQTVRTSYDDAGRNFRDNASRKMASEAMEEALFNVLHGIKL